MNKKKVFIAIALVSIILLAKPLWWPVVFIPNLLPETQIRPLEWITRQPKVDEIEIPHNGSFLRADIYKPSSIFQPRKILLLVHGANEAGKDDPRIENLGQTFARSNIVVLIPTFPDITRAKFTPEAIGQIKSAYKWLKLGYPDAEAGMVGFSVASGPMLIAAADEPADMLVSFGGYYDLKSVLKYMTTGQFEYHDQVFQNTPDPFGQKLISEQYKKLFGDDQKVDALLNNTDPTKFDDLYIELPEHVKQFIIELSPGAVLADIKSKKILLVHSQPDLIVPHTESLELKDGLGQNAEVVFLEVFSHVNIQFSKATLSDAAELYSVIFKILY